MVNDEVRIGMCVMHSNDTLGIGTVRGYDGSSKACWEVEFPYHTGTKKYCHVFSSSLVEVKEKSMNKELKFGDRCMAWDLDPTGKGEYVFITKTPHGVMVVECEDWDTELSSDVEDHAGGEYWIGCFLNAELITQKEMTVAEIEEALGYSIKIVKGGCIC